MEKAGVSNEDVGAMFLGEESADLEEVIEDVSSDEELEAQEETEEPEVEEDGEESEEVEASDEDDESEGTVEIEIDGEILEVPERYKDYFLRQQDYTQKTQEIAQQRKAAEVVQQQLEQTRSQYEFAQSIQEEVQQAQLLDQTANQLNQYLRENIDSLSTSDIEKIRFQIQDSQNQRAEIANSLQAKQQEFQQAQEQSRSELLKKGTEVLQQKIPGWGKDQAEQVRDYALSNGFSEAEINNLIDPRQVEILYKASQYEALKSGAAPAIKRVTNAPAIKPKSRNPMPKETQEKLNLRKKLKSNNLSARQKQDLVAKDFGDRWG